jgi:hypothetical protein
MSDASSDGDGGCGDGDAPAAKQLRPAAREREQLLGKSKLTLTALFQLHTAGKLTVLTNTQLQELCRELPVMYGDRARCLVALDAYLTQQAGAHAARPGAV